MPAQTSSSAGCGAFRVKQYLPRSMQATLRALAIAAFFLAAWPAAGGEQEAGAPFEEVRRFAAAAAGQAVAVDDGHFYAIDDRRIEKYDRRTGARIDVWEEFEDGPILHLNSGVVLEGRLYCAHSNYPAVPMWSSIEIFDTATLKPVLSHSFGIQQGSATWVDRRDGSWWVAFAHYEGRGGEPGKGPEWTSLVRFDEQWRRIAGYVFPEAVVRHFAGRGNSGGAWSRIGRIYATGHDARELYVLELPRAGAVLELVSIRPAPIQGQGIAWDPTNPDVLWGIDRRSREVVVMKDTAPPASPAPSRPGAPR
jgi:hypothetical protein